MWQILTIPIFLLRFYIFYRMFLGNIYTLCFMYNKPIRFPALYSLNRISINLRCFTKITSSTLNTKLRICALLTIVTLWLRTLQIETWIRLYSSFCKDLLDFFLTLTPIRFWKPYKLRLLNSFFSNYPFLKQACFPSGLLPILLTWRASSPYTKWLVALSNRKKRE